MSDRSRLVAGTVLAGAVLVPPRVVGAGPVLCPFHRMTGRPCPTCGMTRAVSALAHLELRRAIGFHAFSPLALALLIGTALGVRPPEARRIRVVLAVAWTIYAIVRFSSRGADGRPTARRLRVGSPIAAG